jgi:hypothetical protein
VFVQLLRRRSMLRLPRHELQYVSDLYYFPSLYLHHVFPSKMYSGNLGSYVVVYIVGLHVVLYALCILHGITPLSFPFTEAEHAGAPFISWNAFISDPYILLYFFAVVPIFVILNAITLAIKLRAPTVNSITQVAPILETSRLAKLTERIVRLLCCIGLGAVVGAFVILLLYIMYGLSEYNGSYLLTNAIVCALFATIHLMS